MGKSQAGEPLAQSLPGRLGRELTSWVDAGLITATQATTIAEFELRRAQVSKRGRVARAVALLGGLTLVSGVGSLVAYNWDRIDDTFKLATLGLMLVLALAAALRARKTQTEEVSTALDVTLLVTLGLTLAGLALVSQVYDQDGELWTLLFFWCALTAPVMSYARTRFANYTWYAGLWLSLVSSAEALATWLRESAHLSYQATDTATLMCLGTATAVLAARFAGSRHAGRAAAGLTFFQLHLVALGLFGSLSWLDGGGQPLLWLLGGLAMGILLLGTPKSVARLGWGARPAVLALAGLGTMLFVLPLGFDVDSGFGAFAAFVIFWVVAWHLAERSESQALARFAVAALGIRVVIASFELFDSLLVTGSFLVAIGGGALAWSRWKWTPEPTAGAEP